MVHPKGIDFISVDGKMLLCAVNLQIADLKGQLRRNRAQRIYHAFQPFRPDHRERLCALRVSHREQHTRQATDMVGVVMGKTHDVDGLRTQPCLFQRHLCALAAIDQQAAPVISGQ